MDFNNIKNKRGVIRVSWKLIVENIELLHELFKVFIPIAIDCSRDYESRSFYGYSDKFEEQTNVELPNRYRVEIIETKNDKTQKIEYKFNFIKIDELKFYSFANSDVRKVLK